jgi:hypothetical protein
VPLPEAADIRIFLFENTMVMTTSQKKRWQFPTGKDMQICHNPLAFGYPILRQIMTNPDNCLIGGLEHFLFFHIVGIIIPTDFHIFQRGGSTTNQLSLLVMLVSCGFQMSFQVGSSYQDVYPQPLVRIMFVPIEELMVGRKM